jgi:hypothetical protein
MEPSMAIESTFCAETSAGANTRNIKKTDNLFTSLKLRIIKLFYLQGPYLQGRDLGGRDLGGRGERKKKIFGKMNSVHFLCAVN